VLNHPANFVQRYKDAKLAQKVLYNSITLKYNAVIKPDQNQTGNQKGSNDYEKNRRFNYGHLDARRLLHRMCGQA
jgi:hypothetical protein